MSLLARASVRTRLALWYALAVAVAVVVYGAIVYGFFRAAMLEQLDERLRDDYERVEHRIVGERRVRGPEPEEAGHHGEAAWAEVSVVGGPVVLRPDPAALDRPPYRTHEGVHRVGESEYRIRVGRSEQPLRHELGELLLLLAGCLVPIAGLAFLGGRWLAGRTLAPVESMTSRAREIGADRLSERLPVPNPDDELGRLATAFNETFARIEGAFERLRRFTSDASHELRTPLAAIRAVGEVAMRDARTPEELRDAVGSMLEEGGRLARLVDDLLVLCRSDAGSVVLCEEDVPLAALARDVAATLGVLAEEKRLRIVVEEERPATVRADPRRLRQAVTNLLDNAIRHSPPGATVRVVVGVEGDRASVAVVDLGPGIAAEHRPHVFERFYRADPSRAAPGSGLGLAIARSAVEAHGGRIELESEEGRGSTFRIVLPAGGRRLSSHPT